MDCEGDAQRSQASQKNSAALRSIASKCDDGEIAALRVELNSKQKAVINEMQGRIKAEAQRDIWKSLYEQERSNEA